MAQETVLVVEDDDNILELITYHLKKAGFGVSQTFTGEEALERASVDRPDLILLDLMLPKISGLEVCAKLKGDTATRTIPIIIVSARGADTDVVAGLEAGADGYIIKPFRPPDLLTSVRDMLSRATRPQPEPGQDLVWAELWISPAKQEVRVAGDSVVLTEAEFQVLWYLVTRAGQICTRGQIGTVLGFEDEGATDSSVDDHVVQLTKKLGDTGSCIETVRRIGYRFKDPGS